MLALRDDPTLIQAEIDRRLATLRGGHPATARRDALKRDLAHAQSAIRRLIDGYQEQLVILDELRARTSALRKREATIQAQLDALDAALHDATTHRVKDARRALTSPGLPQVLSSFGAVRQHDQSAGINSGRRRPW